MALTNRQFKKLLNQAIAELEKNRKRWSVISALVPEGVGSTRKKQRRCSSSMTTTT